VHVHMPVKTLVKWLTDSDNTTTFAQFAAGLQRRFGHDKQILVRIAHRKQKQDESVQSYNDDVHLLFAQSEYPEALRRDALLSNLKPSLHKKVLLSIPRTAAEVVEHAVCIEAQEGGSRTVERLKEWENS